MTSFIQLSITCLFLFFQEKPVDDGSRFVWSILNRTGSKYEYVCSDSLPKLSCFKMIPNEQAIWGDVAWWKGFIGLYDATNASVLTSQGSISLSQLEDEHGKVIYFRYVRPVFNDSTKIK